MALPPAGAQDSPRDFGRHGCERGVLTFHIPLECSQSLQHIHRQRNLHLTAMSAHIGDLDHGMRAYELAPHFTL